MRYATQTETVQFLARAGLLIEALYHESWLNMQSAIMYYNEEAGRPVWIVMTPRPYHRIAVIGAPMTFNQADMSRWALTSELNEWLARRPATFAEKCPQRLRCHESYASYVVLRAAYDAMDFGDTNIAAYVQNSYDVCTADDRCDEQFCAAVREQLALIGYRW